MFNIDGGKLIVIILAGLVVLGPEELPGMLRRVGRLYGELRRLSDGVQHDLRSTFADPANELRQTSDLLRSGVKDLVDTVTNVSFGRDEDDPRPATTTVWPPPTPAPPAAPMPAARSSATAG